MQIERTLSDLADRVTRAKEELRIIEEQLVFQTGVVDEAHARMLVAETPLADREFRIARDDHARLLRQRDKVSAEIEELHREQDRVLDRMLASKA